MAKPQLQQVSAHAWAWLDDSGRWGQGNCGLVAQGSGGLLVNTRHDRKQTDSMLATIGMALPDVRVDHVVVTDASPYRRGGLGALEGVEPIVAHGAAAEMPGRISAAETAALVGSTPPALPLGRYLRETLGDVDFAEIADGCPAGSFGGRTTLQLGSEQVELIELGPAHTESDTVVWLPGDSVLFTGDLLSPGVHPAVWSGSVTGWHAACARLAALRPLAVVPGHGPVTDILGIIDFRDYLRHLHEEVRRRFDQGMPVEEAVVDIPLGHWEAWSHRENLAVTVATLYRQLGDKTPRSYADSMTLAAEVAAGLRRRPRIAPLPPAEQRGETAKALGLAAGDAAIFDFHRTDLPNIHTTLVRHVRLYEQTVPIARGVVSGLLGGRDREMTILRSAWRCSAAYQWSHHRHMALSVGLTEAEIDLLSHDLADGTWSRHETALLNAVDELHADSVIGDETWSVLEESFGERELIELVTLVGEYHKVSFQLNSWRVPLEGWAGPYQLPSGWALPAED